MSTVRITIDEVDKDMSVLVDGQSILDLFEVLADPDVLQHYLSNYGSPLSGTVTGNLIENLIIYEHVLVDSQLIEVNERCRETCGLFPDAIKALRIRAELRAALGAALSRVIPEDQVLWDSGNPTVTENWEIRRNDGEHMFHYQKTDNVLSVDKFLELAQKGEVDKLEYEHGISAVGLSDTGRSFLRAHFYLELARNLDLYLSPHPYRAKYFAQLTTLPAALPKRVVGFVDQRMTKSAAAQFLNLNLTIPPVADYVLRIVRRKRVNLITAIHEIRESKNARLFRQWCSKVSAALKEERGGLQEAQKINKELDEVCAMWERDIAEGVRYKQRHLNVGKLPIVGALLSFSGIEKIKINDPLLTIDKPYLLFLNELYR